jgi:diguanylate cyclase (GGDEF)-like protein/PAS domain S-box-containing protein
MILVSLVQKRRNLPFEGIFLMFAMFILAGGTIHWMAVWPLWNLDYWFFESIQLIMALVFLYRAAELLTLIPHVLGLPSRADLEAAQEKLAQEIRLREAAIQERISLEKALKLSESRFHLIFENAAIGIFLADADGKILATNPAFRKMLGYNHNELCGIHFREFNHPDQITFEETLYQEMFAGLCDFYQVEKLYLSKEGQLVWGNLSVSLVRQPEGKPQFSIVMVENITQRKQAEEALQFYQQYLEELVGVRTAELTEVNRQLSWQANHDPLTGLVNRREFERCLEKAVNNARTSHKEHTLCYMDLDRFKIVNDTCGHLAGDELLRQISSLLQSKCRKTDTLARLGGDEFGLLLYQCSLEEALRVVQTLYDSVQEFKFVWQDKSFSLGISIGLVAIDTYCLSPKNILHTADKACYAAKKHGRNQVQVLPLDQRELQEQR